jgi:hypothetical protein
MHLSLAFCVTIFPIKTSSTAVHSIHIEDLLPQRMHIGSWYEDKAYSTLEKLYTILEKVEYCFS